MDVIDLALKDERDYPNRSSSGYLALKRLGDRLHHEYESVYGHEESPPDLVSKKATGRTLMTPSAGRAAWSGDTVYQFKVTLLDTRPPIWRRIQVKDCTLDKLHEHIQTAMGWTNSHLHHFWVGEQLYGDPMLMAENFEDMAYKDSTTTKVSDILPKNGKRFRFVYEYDFGDGWQHEVLFERCVQAEASKKYPLCMEGARACPPEDVGGTWGYADFLDAIQDPDNERYEELREWVGGSFEPEDFDEV
ncbi:MAG: plasmid pRiA4b ORF-3 family protein [Singulisphaera sp.]|nr:plasmid pRiA4b ORF-3 family protein [Singulisphaera sp.]